VGSHAEIAATRIASTTLTMGVRSATASSAARSRPRTCGALARRIGGSPQIDLEALKSLGTYKVAIKVFTGMTPEVTIVVEPKG
jgi:hypothetical protein